MVERKTPAKSEVVKTAPKELIGRFYDLQKEVATPKPYILTEDIVIPPLTRGQMVAISEASNEEAANRVVFGAHYDAVNALYENRPIAEWRAFESDLNQHFFGLAAEEAPGKSPESYGS